MSIEYRLSFLKPWKSVNETRFHLTEQGSGTKVTWSMQGSLPFFMFFLKGMMTGWVPTATVYAVTHTGPYRHIGNAWSAGMMHAQAKVFAKDKRFQPYEVYLNDPREVAEEDILTVVNFGVKE